MEKVEGLEIKNITLEDNQSYAGINFVLNECEEATVENIIIKNSIDHADSDFKFFLLKNSLIRNLTILNTNNIKRKKQAV